MTPIQETGPGRDETASLEFFDNEMKPLYGLSNDEAATVELFFYAIKPFYEPPSDYHNFYEHIREGFPEAMRLCGEAEKDGHRPNRLIVAIGFLGHDPGYNHDLFEDFDIKRWGTKENYHAHITGTILRSMGVEEEIVQPVELVITGTHVDAERTTIEEEIVSMADVSNVPSEYGNYVLKSCEFFKESVLRGANIDLAKFRSIADMVLGKYFSGIKILTDIDRDENGKTFVERGYENMAKFRDESPQAIIKLLGKQATRFASVLQAKAKTASEGTKDQAAS